MSKIDKIRELIEQGKHADALMDYCVGDFSGDEYTQEDREQVALWRIECLIGTIPMADLGVFAGKGKVYEHSQKKLEYNPEYEQQIEILEKFLFGLFEFIQTEKTKDEKIQKYHKFREYLLNVLIERFKNSVYAYGERIEDAESCDLWLRFYFGFNFLNDFVSLWIYRMGLEIPCDEHDFMDSYTLYDIDDDLIKSAWECSTKLNDLYENISNGDYILEHNSSLARNLLTTVDVVENAIILTLQKEEHNKNFPHSYQEKIVIKKKIKAAFLLTGLNAVVAHENGDYGALFPAAERRNKFTQGLIQLEKDIQVLDPEYTVVDKISNPYVGTATGTFSQTNSAPQSTSGGCYVATAVYGSYDCPEVWTLRRYRDNALASTWCGRAFISTYYAISPTLVKWFGHTEWFKNMWRGTLDRMVENLQSKGYESTPYDDKKW